MTDPATSIVIATATAMPKDAELVVSTLEGVGGSLKHFISLCPENADQNDEIIIAGIERWLKNLDDKGYYRRWNEAIKANQVTRLRLLQNRAIERLESLSGDAEKTEINWLVMAKEAAAFKMILGDLFAGQTYQAKQKPIITEDAKDDDEDALIAQLLGGS